MVIEDAKNQYKSAFLGNLIQDLKLNNWVDIENRFYQKLNSIINQKKDQEQFDQAINQLNKEFRQIQDLLENYLKTKVADVFIPEAKPAFTKIFKQELQEDDFSTSNLIKRHQTPNQTLFLNFNYTKTIVPYLYNYDESKPSLINIHGELFSKTNPIIFGFGDEIDSNYDKIEKMNDNRLFSFIKSFMYFQTTNYYDLLRFIESEKFQLFIIGHSCGLSDRTMLNYICESDNCESIKLFYYKNRENYIAQTQELSRHFTNKAMMRHKIVPFSISEPCPQVELKRKNLQ